MPLPWKKSRFSQLVAGHLHSPQRGGSLVVETGFPTSLIDLFVKNRDRLKKSSKKKKKKQRSEPDATASADLNPDLSRPSNQFTAPPPLGCISPAMALNSRDSTPPIGSQNSRFPALPMLSRESRFADSPVVSCSPRDPASGTVTPRDEEIVDDGIVGDGGEIADAKRVFVAISGVLLMVALALGTKQLAVGITVSAFLLIFLEYAGKRLFRLLKPCQEALVSLRSLMEKVPRIFRIKKQTPSMKETNHSEAPVGRQETPRFLCESKDTVKEIQIVQPYSNLENFIEERQSSRPNTNLIRAPIEDTPILKDDFVKQHHRGRWESEEIGRRSKVLDFGSDDKTWGSIGKETKEHIMERQPANRDSVGDDKNHRSGSGKMRSNVKKLVSNKLRSSKEKRSDSKKDASCPGGDDKLAMAHEREIYDDPSSSLSSGLQAEPVDDQDAIFSNVELLSLADREDGMVIKDKAWEIRILGKSGYFVLFLIVLVGLVGGRVLAIASTLTWFFALKSAGTLHRFIRNPNKL